MRIFIQVPLAVISSYRSNSLYSWGKHKNSRAVWMDKCFLATPPGLVILGVAGVIIIIIGAVRIYKA